MGMIGMTWYFDNEIVFPHELDKEIAAIEALREDFDEDVDFRTLFDELLGNVDEWQNANKKYNTRVYVKLGNVYRLYIFTYRNPKRERLVEGKCDEHKIPKTSATGVCGQWDDMSTGPLCELFHTLADF
jgi:hypothetical protein